MLNDDVVEAHCYIGSMNEMKRLSIERSKSVLTADEALRSRNVLLPIHLLHSMLRSCFIHA